VSATPVESRCATEVSHFVWNGATQIVYALRKN
jgi:hypothetical protein